MKQNLLLKTAIASALAAALSACGGTDSGYDSGYKKNNNELTFETEQIVVEFDEETGLQTIDLLEGAVVNGEPAANLTTRIVTSQLLFEAEDNFETPQGPSNTVPNQTISPFVKSEDSRMLYVDTDAFAEALRACDDTDVRGDRDSDNNPIPDGFPDYPTQAVYEITYTIDHGYPMTPGEPLPERTLRLTINATDDPVTGVNIAPLELPAGGTAQLVASTVPTYACNQELTYSSADEDVATVDAAGLVTGVMVGETSVTATSVDNPEASATDTVTVTSAFSIAITNQDTDDLGTPTGHKQVAACTATGINVQPFELNDNLTGEYGYQWTLTNEVDYVKGMSWDSGVGGFGEVLAVKMPADIGSINTVDVELVSGETGGTPISEVTPKSMDMTVVNNQMCDPGTSAHPAGWFIDFDLDFVQAAYLGNASYSASDDVVAGSAASVRITAGAGEAEWDGETVPYSWGAQQVWNNQRNWYTANYGQGLNSIGDVYRFGVWVKLEQVPAEPVTLRQAIVAWNYEGKPDDAVGFQGRYSGAGLFSAVLESTTEWQYVEFIDDRTGERDWAVPATWNAATPVFTLWEVFNLPQGSSILLDEYSVTNVDLIAQ
ncbi:Ig-like domain-containing protein [Neiella sp. HB171785]|uniref:Ig-like domain-containing protein n=1 Tax=Neiella litorisoli TaxID=2771431 RepID=A0A8J6R1Y4_9GAMM|nr:Ig-like domain-containing protein [Neiella litorisoli]MBD1388345.1 Ig-like domain-containing protein [Neiella litorisoli]